MSIVLEQVNYRYGEKTAYEKCALSDINLTLEDGAFVALIGHTGSGKSTLIQHLNGLIRATSGRILYQGQDIYEKKYDLRALRSKVGLVFQYPEHQLFETTVKKDVAFGPKNQGLDGAQVEERVEEALRCVGLPEDLWEASPFELSGGQKRRVAIAGVLAMHPDFLILDEPTAGLDPKGRDELLEQLEALHKERGIGILLVSHSMEDVAHVAERILVMNQGRLLLDGTPKEVFAQIKELEQVGLAAPQVTYLIQELKEKGLPVEGTVTTLEEAKKEILKIFS